VITAPGVAKAVTERKMVAVCVRGTTDPQQDLEGRIVVAAAMGAMAGALVRVMTAVTMALAARALLMARLEEAQVPVVRRRTAGQLEVMVLMVRLASQV
jgi:hypothetical protein